MQQPEKLFANIFNDREITSLRLSNFAADAITRFTISDCAAIFKDQTTAIVATQDPFHAGLSEIDTSLGIKKGKTQTLNEVTDLFGSFMSSYKNEIVRAIGGTDSATFVAFYPHGVMEYTNANLTEMPLLVKRINTLATANASKLGEKLTLDLQAFVGQWEAAITEQTTVQGSLDDGRADRSTLRHNLELALLKAIRSVAIQFPDDVSKCMSFFDFSLLTNVGRKTQTPAPVAVTPTV